MNKLLLCNYTLSVWLSRGKKDLIKKGTCFFLSSELFCFVITLAMFLVSLLPFKLSDIVLLILLVVIGYCSYYLTEKWILKKIDELKIENQFNQLNSIKLIRFLGLVLYFGSFLAFFLIGILTFEGYSR